MLRASARLAAAAHAAGLVNDEVDEEEDDDDEVDEEGDDDDEVDEVDEERLVRKAREAYAAGAQARQSPRDREVRNRDAGQMSQACDNMRARMGPVYWTVFDRAAQHTSFFAELQGLVGLDPLADETTARVEALARSFATAATHGRGSDDDGALGLLARAHAALGDAAREKEAFFGSPSFFLWRETRVCIARLS